jgi:hypothetical protein
MRVRLSILVLATFVHRTPLAALEERPLAAPEKESSPAPALTIDNWVPKDAPKSAEPELEPEMPETTAKPPSDPSPSADGLPATAPAASKDSATARPAPTVEAGLAPAVPRVAMNAMSGTLTSIDADARTLRLSVGGVNPQLAYTKNTAVLVNGRRLTVDALKIDDQVTVRYIGKDLTAVEIEVIPEKRSS